MSHNWMVIGLFWIIAGCASVTGTSVPLDDTNKNILGGKWVGTFEARGKLTGTVYTTRAVTFVMDPAKSNRGSYMTSISDGALDWRVENGKALISVDQGRRAFRSSGQISGERDDFVFTVSRATDDSIYLQTSWEVSVRDSEGRVFPQNHSIILKKQ